MVFPPPPPPPNLLDSNAKWAERVGTESIKKWAAPQKPHTLWIGCSDSRVPASLITGANPGDIFVHRNIANQVHLNDTNLLSVLKFAVQTLKVQQVVVVGHSECGGAKACLAAARRSDRDQPTLIPLPGDSHLNAWLEPLTEFTRTLKLPDTEAEQLPFVVNENIKRQVKKLAQTDTMREAWKAAPNTPVLIHGWLYDLSTGKLKNLNVSEGPPSASEAPEKA